MDRKDAGVAIAAGAAALAVFVATLAPGLIAITDTPKFQFIGRILGTAHAPGYPLYVLVSHVFGYLPVGSLAYRINLMSAVFGASACGLAFLAARRLGAGRAPALAAALAFAFGPTVWYVSTIAEVYTLNACFVAAVLVVLLVWQRTQRAGWFYAAVALVGVALGNHTTTVFLIPATAIFAVLAAPTFALHPRTIVTSASIVALALTQYLFIILRTRQGVWGDAPAWNLSGLLRVASGSEYFSDMVPEGLSLSADGAWRLVGQKFLDELSLVGAALSCLGAALVWRRSKAALMLLAVALACYAAFAAVYRPGAFEVFLIPGFIVCWLLAAAGAQGVVDLMRARAGRWGAALAAGVLVVAPAWQLARNYHTRDLSRNRADMRFFDALFDRLPDRSALLHEDFLVDRMVYYKTLGEQVTRGRSVLALMDADLEPVGRAWHDRYGVFAFPVAARTMRLLDGAEFSYTPLDFSGGTVERYLDDLPRNAIVAVGLPARHLRSFASGGRLPLGAIGFGGLIDNRDASSGLAMIGARGAREAERRFDPVSARVQLGTPFAGGAAPALPPISVHVEQDAASIAFGGREILRTEAGMAVAVWTRGGLMAAFAVQASAPAPPTLPTFYGVYPLRALRERQTIGAGSTDLTPAAAAGSFIYKTGSGRSRLVLDAGRGRPLAPALLESSSPEWPALNVRAFEGPHARSGDLHRSLEEDSLPSDGRLLGMKRVYRIAIDTSQPSSSGMHVGLGGLPEVVYGRLLEGDPGLVYGLDLATHLVRVDDRTMSFHVARDHHAHLVGAGWSQVQADRVGPYSETIDREAELLLPIGEPGRKRLGVQLLPLPGGAADSPATVELRVNGQPLPALTPEREWKRYWWDVPSGAVRSGVNSVVLVVSPPGQRIAVSDVLIETTIGPAAPVP